MQDARGDRRKSAIGNRCWGLKPVADLRRRGQAGEHSLAPLSHSYDRPRRGRVMHIFQARGDGLAPASFSMALKVEN